MPVPIQILSRILNYSNNRSRNSSYNRYRNYSNDRNRNYSYNRNPRYQNITIIKKRSHDSSQNRISSYNNRQKNYFQSPHGIKTRYQNSQQIYRSSTPKHQRQINQVQINCTNSTRRPHFNCESTDSESDTENTVWINMINVEIDYEPIKYELPIYSHIYQNHDQLVLSYYTRPISNKTTKEKIEKIVEEITEQKPTEC